MVVCFFTFYCCYGNHSCTIRCYFENGGVAALKGLFNVLNNNKLFLFFDILTQNMLKEIDIVFYMISLAFIISERHLNLYMIILTSFSFRGVLTSRSNLTIVFLFKCSYLNNYTIDSCMKFSAFVQRSLINMIYVKTENHILCH